MMATSQIQIKIQSLIDSLAHIKVMATWTESENLPDYLDEISDEVRDLSSQLKC